MNCLLYVSSSAAVLSKTRHFITRTSSSFGFYNSSLWKRSFDHAAIKSSNLDSLLTRFRVQCFSSSSPRRRQSSRSRKSEAESLAMEEEKTAFYVVRKGNMIGVYKSLVDCQAQVGSSVCDPSVSVYKGHSLPEEAEEYLTARGLQNALYCISASDVKEDLFGQLVPCPFQEPASSKGKASVKSSPPKRSLEILESGSLEACQSPFSSSTLKKHVKLDNSVKAQPISSKCTYGPAPKWFFISTSTPLSEAFQQYKVRTHVPFSLMVLQKEILEKLAQGQFFEQMMEVWFADCVKVWALQPIMLLNIEQ